MRLRWRAKNGCASTKEPALSDKTANLKLGGALSVATAALLATQAPFSVLAAQHLSLAIFVGITALALLICVPFMLVTKKARVDFWSLVSSLSHLGKFAVLLLIGLAGQALYAVGLGKGHPVVVAAVLNLDPFWAALIAFLVLGKTIPTSRATFCACLVVAFVGALAIAVSQSDGGDLSHLTVASFLGAGIALPIPVLTALSGTLVGKWFGSFDELACLAVTFATSAAVIIPVTFAIAYFQSDLRISPDAYPAVVLLAIGTVLAAAAGRIVYQKALTITDNDNGFVSMFFLFIPAFTSLLSLVMSHWIKELTFKASPTFFVGLALVALPIFVFSWRSWRAAEASDKG
jgi:drug/metabolite transporter (DMT)-like permease